MQLIAGSRKGKAEEPKTALAPKMNPNDKSARIPIKESRALEQPSPRTAHSVNLVFLPVKCKKS
jgi:hypothetical protein